MSDTAITEPQPAPDVAEGPDGRSPAAPTPTLAPPNGRKVQACSAARDGVRSALRHLERARAAAAAARRAHFAANDLLTNAEADLEAIAEAEAAAGKQLAEQIKAGQTGDVVSLQDRQVKAQARARLAQAQQAMGVLAAELEAAEDDLKAAELAVSWATRGVVQEEVERLAAEGEAALNAMRRVSRDLAAALGASFAQGPAGAERLKVPQAVLELKDFVLHPGFDPPSARAARASAWADWRTLLASDPAAPAPGRSR